MKIDQQNTQQSGGASGAQQTAGAQQVKGGRGTSSSRSAYGLGGDSVELSSLSEAVRAYSTESPDRSLALSQIGRDVHKGSYQVDSLSVSRGVIADALLP
jgi:anti-sigma28 factor (negative regulator of flagellin synthesis)